MPAHPSPRRPPAAAGVYVDPYASITSLTDDQVCVIEQGQVSIGAGSKPFFGSFLHDTRMYSLLCSYVHALKATSKMFPRYNFYFRHDAKVVCDPWLGKA